MRRDGRLQHGFNVAPEGGRLLVEVLWEGAEEALASLRAAGIPATAVFDPEEHTARLEVPGDADPEEVRAALGG